MERVFGCEEQCAVARTWDLKQFSREVHTSVVEHGDEYLQREFASGDADYKADVESPKSNEAGL